MLALRPDWKQSLAHTTKTSCSLFFTTEDRNRTTNMKLVLLQVTVLSHQQALLCLQTPLLTSTQPLCFAMHKTIPEVDHATTIITKIPTCDKASIVPIDTHKPKHSHQIDIHSV